jgi:tetratricopeptide (TPR) repeat protein
MSVQGKNESAATLNARGMDLTAGERYEEAIAAFDRALELEPGNMGIRYNRGEAYRRAGRSAEARADLEAVLAAEGESADLLLALGLVAYEADDFESAAERYERALVLKSDYPEAWNDLGVVEFRRGDYERARKHLERAVELSSDYAEAWLNLADTYSELKMDAKYRQALARGKALGARSEDED